MQYHLLAIPAWVYHLLHRFQSSYTRKILIEAIDLFNQLWPYVVVGIVLSTVIKLYVSKKSLVKYFAANSSLSIFLAALLGVVSPLGSYVVIPLAAALVVGGVPVSVLMAFLVASPIINPSLFALTAGAFGFEMAFARLISAFLIGLFAGWFTQRMVNVGKIDVSELVNKSYTIIDTKNLPHEKTGVPYFFKEIFRFTIFISKFFFIAIFIAAGIKIFMSPKWVINLFSDDNILSVIISTGAGVPFYVCGGAAIPVVQSLAALGLQKGAVLAYFISGPVTKISNLVIMNSAFNFKLFLIYLVSGLSGAILFGIIYNLL